MMNQTSPNNSASKREKLLLKLNFVVLMFGCAYIAQSSTTTSSECEEFNNCDGMVFRGVGNLLASGEPNVYDWNQLAAWWTGISGASPSIELPFAYPPTFLPFFELWGMLDPQTVAIGITVLTLAIFGMAISRLSSPLVAFVACAGGWTFFNAFLAQTGLVVASGGALVALGLKKEPRALVPGLVLLSLKPHYALYILVGLVLSGRWKPVAQTAAVGGLLSVWVTLRYGASQCLGWAEAIAGVPGRSHPSLDFGYMSGWTALIPAGGPHLSPLATLLFIVGIAPAAAAWHRLQPMRALGFSIALACLLAPHAHPYDLGLWVVPILATWKDPIKPMLGLGVLVLIACLLGIRFPLALASAGLTWYCWRPQSSQPNWSGQLSITKRNPVQLASISRHSW